MRWRSARSWCGGVVDLVVPTLGQPSLAALLHALAGGDGPSPEHVSLVDDRRAPTTPLPSREVPAPLAGRVRVLRGRAAGPAAARNVGWRASSAEWIAFVDDDVVPDRDWRARLAEDLATVPSDVGGVQGRLRVPLPSHRRPTDRERNVRGLETARWATADMAYRRAALLAVDGFDERFPRAYREDADLAVRVRAAGWRLVQGRRSVAHPVRPADRWISVRLQAGNADDALMRARHGRDWKRRAGIPRGRRAAHVAVTAAGAAAALALVARRPRLAALAAAAWLGGTAEFSWRRIGHGPRTRDEVVTMLLTSAAIPPVAVYHWLRGWLGVAASRRAPTAIITPHRVPRAVLLDRDGTLIVDVPHNGDPSASCPCPARARRSIGCAPRAWRLPSCPIRAGSRAGSSAPSRWRRSTGASRSCSDRSDPGSCARTRPRTAARAASPRPG